MSTTEKLNLNFKKGYDPDAAKALSQCCSLAYHQYKKHKPDIEPPPGYKQIAALTAPETLNGRPVPFGFVLASLYEPVHFIVAIRGTVNLYELLADADLRQERVDKKWFDTGNDEDVKVHKGFLSIYELLGDQIIKACSGLNAGAGYITGHSLGGALAILAAATCGTVIHPGKGKDGLIQMYNFGGPRLGDSNFAAAYDVFLPYSYRVTNQADACPIVPPEKFLTSDYKHIGTEYAYLWQTSDIFANHDLENNYHRAVEKGIPTKTTEQQSAPCSCPRMSS